MAVGRVNIGGVSVQKLDLMPIARSGPRYGIPYNILYDENYLYVSGNPDSTNDFGIVTKYDRHTLDLVQAGPALGSYPRGMFMDDAYIYYGSSASNNMLRKHKKSDLSLDRERDSQIGYINYLTGDETYLYASGNTTRTIAKYHKTLALVGQTTVFSSTTSHKCDIFVLDENYIYAFINTILRIKKYNKSDLAEVGQVTGYGAEVRTMGVDENYIYLAGEDQVIKKYEKDTLTLVGETPSFGSTIWVMAVEDKSIYVSGTGGVIKEYDKATLTLKSESIPFASSGSAVRPSAMSTDDNYIYMGVDDYGLTETHTKNIKKFAKHAYIKK